MEEKQEKQLENIKEKVFKENAMSLRIARIPPETKKQFIDLATTDFCGDYGMTLKWLMEDRWNRLLSLELKMAELESKITGKPVKLVTTMSGRVIGGAKNE